MTPYTCDTCDTVVTDHDLSDDTIARGQQGWYTLLCDKCFDALPEDEDEDEDDGEWPADRPFDPYKFYGVNRCDFY